MIEARAHPFVGAAVTASAVDFEQLQVRQRAAAAGVPQVFHQQVDGGLVLAEHDEEVGLLLEVDQLFDRDVARCRVGRICRQHGRALHCRLDLGRRVGRAGDRWQHAGYCGRRWRRMTRTWFECHRFRLGEIGPRRWRPGRRRPSRRAGRLRDTDFGGHERNRCRRLLARAGFRRARAQGGRGALPIVLARLLQRGQAPAQPARKGRQQHRHHEQGPGPAAGVFGAQEPLAQLHAQAATSLGFGLQFAHPSFECGNPFGGRRGRRGGSARGAGCDCHRLQRLLHRGRGRGRIRWRIGRIELESGARGMATRRGGDLVHGRAGSGRPVCCALRGTVGGPCRGPRHGPVAQRGTGRGRRHDHLRRCGRAIRWRTGACAGCGQRRDPDSAFLGRRRDQRGRCRIGRHGRRRRRRRWIGQHDEATCQSGGAACAEEHADHGLIDRM